MVLSGVIASIPAAAAKTLEQAPTAVEADKCGTATGVNLSNYDLRLAENFTTLNTGTFLAEYLKSWLPDPATTATPRYTLQNSALNINIDQNQPVYFPSNDTKTKISGFQTFARDGLHSYNASNSVQRHERVKNGYVGRYGYYEVCAKIAPGSGTHSAWWMLGLQQKPGQSAEIDVVEDTGAQPDVRKIRLHPVDDPNVKYDWVDKPVSGLNSAQNWTKFGLEWLPGKLNFYTNGQLTFSTNSSPSYPMMHIFSVYEGESGYRGPVDPSVPYPKSFSIDSFNAYALKGEPTDYFPDVAPGENIAKAGFAGADNTSTQARMNMKPSEMIAGLNDGNTATSWVSKPNPTFPVSTYIDWMKPQTFNTVTLASHYGTGQGPTKVDIQVSSDGLTNWQTVASSDIAWTKGDGTVEKRDISFPGVTGKKAVRVLMKAANTTWDHVALNDIEVWNR